MTYSDFCAGQLALFGWRESRKYGSNANHGLAIINCLANRQRAGLCGGDMLQLIYTAPSLAYNNLEDQDWRTFPDYHDKTFEALREEAKDVVDGWKSGGMVSGFSIGSFNPRRRREPGVPALYYADLSAVTRPWFRENILAHPDEHPRLVEVQPLIFFA